MRKFKYLTAYTVPVVAAISFLGEGWITFSLVLYSFLVIPLLELFTPIQTNNLSEEEEASFSQSKWFDYLLYAVVPVQFGFLIWFLYLMQQPEVEIVDKFGYIATMGMLCGIYGINVAHELGHRVTKHERFMAKALLLTSMYMHFYIEHNRGHHKRVSTDEDPASARHGEFLYGFWVRSIIFSYISAWEIGAQAFK